MRSLPAREKIDEMLTGRSIDFFSFDEWKVLDDLEIQRGRATGFSTLQAHVGRRHALRGQGKRLGALGRIRPIDLGLSWRFSRRQQPE